MKQKIIRTPWDRRGFTLVELLVVISIIALLVSILLPALNKARLQAKYVMCASNQHQIIIGLNTYQAEWDGKLPPSIQGWSWLGGTRWGGPGFLEAGGAMNGGSIGMQLRKYLPDVNIFICPAVPFDENRRILSKTYQEHYSDDENNLPGGLGSAAVLLSTYYCLWNYKGCESIGFKPADKGKHTLMISEHLYYQDSSWRFNHPAKSAFRNLYWACWEMADPTETLPEIQQNAGYLDGHVARTTVHDWMRYQINQNSPPNIYLPKEWK